MTKIALIAGDAHPRLGQDIARDMGAPLIPVSISAFADGETRIRIEGDVRNTDLYIVQPTSHPTNERLMTLALIADAARGGGAARVTAVIPYFGYARQDVRKNPGDPLSAQLAARILGCAGVDRVVTLELHSPALESAFAMPLLHLSTDALMLPAIRSCNFPDLVIVAPDAGGFKRAQRYATELEVPLAAVTKTRLDPDIAVTQQLIGNVQGKTCLLVDDMVSTGGTIAGAAHALLAAGAQDIHVLFIHAVMASRALENMLATPVKRIFTTDSVVQAPHPRVETISTAPLIAQALMQRWM